MLRTADQVDKVLHFRDAVVLVAISRPMQSWDVPRETAELNALVPELICELLVSHLPRCRLFQASSSEIFGSGLPLRQNELTHCVPETPYGIAKLYAHRIVGVYRQRFGLHACSGIMFNHESPRRPLAFVSQKIAYAAAAIALGMTETPAREESGRPIVSDSKLYLGDIGVRRDFGFAGDYVEAMHMLLQHPTPDDYVIGTGQSHSIQEFCEVAFRTVDRNWTEHVHIDPKLIRKIDSRYTCADTTKLRNVYDWTPKTSFEELVTQMVSAQIRTLSSGDFVDAV